MAKRALAEVMIGARIASRRSSPLSVNRYGMATLGRSLATLRTLFYSLSSRLPRNRTRKRLGADGGNRTLVYQRFQTGFVFKKRFLSKRRNGPKRSYQAPYLKLC